MIIRIGFCTAGSLLAKYFSQSIHEGWSTSWRWASVRGFSGGTSIVTSPPELNDSRCPRSLVRQPHGLLITIWRLPSVTTTVPNAAMSSMTGVWSRYFETVGLIIRPSWKSVYTMRDTPSLKSCAPGGGSLRRSREGARIGTGGPLGAEGTTISLRG